jgi:hypothetical protein
MHKLLGPSVLGLLLAAVTVSAAPALPEKSPRWEYAELQAKSTARAFQREGDEVPVARPALRWTTGTAEVEAKDWLDLAEKLKATGVKKDGTVTQQRIALLNYLGSEGWELVSHTGGTTPTGAGMWLFKRRAP